MSQRYGIWTLGLCFGAAAILAVGAFLSFFHLISVQPGWGLLFSGLMLMMVGWHVQSGMKSATEIVTHRQSQAELLQAQLEEQRNAVDAMADGLEIAIFICDPSATVLYANRRATELFRFERPVGRNILAVTLSYDLEQLVIMGGKTESPQSGEISFTYPDERVGLAKVWSTEEGGERCFLSVYEITDLRRLERVRHDFVANVSHELRTPMTIIRSMAETLIDDEPALSERSSKYLLKIMSEVDRLSMISQDLLILSAAESNPVRKQMCDICDVFKGTVHQLESKAKGKDLDLTFEGPDRCIVEANTSQMTQVALNLIDNAINYTTTGAVHVNVVPGDTTVQVMVTDTGLGIPSDQVNRIFERFYRIDRARSRSTGGTGLGLSIVKHIVEAHGGVVTVESALNHGSTFTVELPVGG